MPYAVIENDTVVNVVESSPEWAVRQGWVDIPEAVGIGWQRQDGEWIAPATWYNADSVSA
jgi:hypothetical protein